MFKLPPLPYTYDALEPYIDVETMHVHHDKHHRGYVDKLNESLEEHPSYRQYPLDRLLREVDALPAKLRISVIRNGGGHYNHSLFWKGLCPRGKEEKGLLSPKDELAKSIDRDFGSFEDFRVRFSDLANSHFASGWAWLSVDDHYDEKGDLTRKLLVHTTQDHENPLTRGLYPLFVVDLWEHAYYLKYQNRRPEFLEALWNIVNWDEVAMRFTAEDQQVCSAA